MEVPLDFVDKHTPETLDREATRPINTLSAVHIRVQQTNRVIAKCDKGPVIQRMYLIPGRLEHRVN